jgi:ribonuclease P protein component
MLPKLNRLIKKRDFEMVFKKGRGFKEGFLVFRVAKNNFKNSRFGFVVGKSVSKKATIRNRIKRRLRELVKIKIRKIKNGIDGVFIVRPGLETKDFWEIEEAINKILKKAKILN